MYKVPKFKKTSIKVNTATQGETLENKIRRILNNKEPISDGAQIIYTERKDGVQPQYDIRTDRFEIAVEAMDKVTGAHQAKRAERQKTKDEATKKQTEPQIIDGVKPIQATSTQGNI